LTQDLEFLPKHVHCVYLQYNSIVVDSLKFKVYFNNIPEGHIPMWIYTMYAGMVKGKYNDKYLCLNSKH